MIFVRSTNLFGTAPIVIEVSSLVLWLLNFRGLFELIDFTSIFGDFSCSRHWVFAMRSSSLNRVSVWPESLELSLGFYLLMFLDFKLLTGRSCWIGYFILSKSQEVRFLASLQMDFGYRAPIKDRRLYSLLVFLHSCGIIIINLIWISSRCEGLVVLGLQSVSLHRCTLRTYWDP